jgi:hypothetical protein
VGLNTGKIGIVKQINHDAPVVLLVKNARNTLLSNPQEQNPSANIEVPKRGITSSGNELDESELFQ